MPAKFTAEVTDELNALGRMVTQLSKHYGGVVVGDIKTAALPDALSKRLGGRQKTDNELCHTCRRLNLVELFNDMKPGLDSLDVRILVGTYDDIVARSYCPFCRLVLSAVNNSLRDPINPGYRTAEGEAVCCLVRRRGASSRFLWKRNLKIELRSIPVKSTFSRTRLHWRLGWENDMRTDNNYLKGIVQDFDAEIVVHNDSAGKYPFPQSLDENDKNNYSSKGNDMLDLKASHKASWWLDPIPLLGCTPEPIFDVQKLLAWHQLCSHCSNIDLTSYNLTRLSTIPGMLLIDTNTMNLVLAPARAAYAVLSYVWGKLKDPFRATKANRDKLMAGGGLIGVALPRTIKESIEVIRAIGFRYFWVDSICIIQDDPESLMGQIKAMDMIYEGASLTLVAAGGNSANDPLSTSRPQIHAEIFGDLKLMARNRPLEAALGRSTWNSRAWCYQEKILSSRMLVFTEGEVYYDCSHFRWCESMASPDSEREISASLKKFTRADVDDGSTQSGGEETENPNPWLVWGPMKSVLEEYTLRALTNENDVLSAVWGVLKSISPDLMNMVGGSPKPYLIYMMLWQPVGPQQRRSTTEVLYPSWSWIGWIGSKRFPELFGMSTSAFTWSRIRHFATSKSTIITSWYFRDYRSGQAPTHLQDVAQLDHRHPKEMKEYVVPLQMIGQEEVISKTRDLTAHQLDQLQQAEVILLKEASRSYVYALKSECSMFDQQADIQSSLRHHNMPDNGLLQFWTESASFAVYEFQVNDSKPLIDTNFYNPFMVADSKNRWVGTIQLPYNWSGKGRKCEFIILSADIVTCSLEQEGRLHEMPKGRKLKSQMKPMGDPTHAAVYFYDVLLIEWNYGIAYRVGLGSIYFEDWDLAGPVQKLVTLG